MTPTCTTSATAPPPARFTSTNPPSSASAATVPASWFDFPRLSPSPGSTTSRNPEHRQPHFTPVDNLDLEPHPLWSGLLRSPARQTAPPRSFDLQNHRRPHSCSQTGDWLRVCEVPVPSLGATLRTLRGAISQAGP